MSISKDSLRIMRNNHSSRDRKIVRATPIFDRAYYRLRWPDVAASGMDAVDHYVLVGAREGRDPSPLFDSAFYSQRHPSETASLNPLVHYVLNGGRKGYLPHPLFDSAFYLRTKQEVTDSRLTPLEQYVVSGSREQGNPHPLFDTPFYLRQTPALSPGVTPLAHYLSHGARTGYDPHPFFDTDYYLDSNPDVAATGTNPLVHYVLHGGFEGRDPHPLFDTDFYLLANPDVAESKLNPLVHYVLYGVHEGRNPHPLFDADYYLRTAPDDEEAGKNPLLHYLLHGAGTRRSPHPLFDVAFYLESSPDVQATGMNPLVHYIRHGAKEGRNPHPLFDGAYYLGAMPEVAAARIDPLVHYLTDGTIPTPSSTVHESGESFRDARDEPTRSFDDNSRTEASTGLVPIVVVGRFYQLSGLGENARSLLRSLNRVGIPSAALNTRTPEDDAGLEFSELCAGQETEQLGGVNIFLQNADEVDYWLGKLDHPPASSHNVVCPMWELAKYPSDWARQLDRFDEIWSISQFIHDAVSPAVSKPCFLLPLAAEVDSSSDLGKERFGLDPSAFTFLFAFDLSGIVERKNPLAVIEAFRKLRTRRPHARVRLVLKVHDSHKWLTAPAELVRCAARETEGVTLLDETLRPSEMRGLLQSCDCFISLHRSEGFGRLLAEALYFGKPVIATGYSGNMQFMNPENSALVDYELVPVPAGAYPFWEAQKWAEPDIDHAASHMLRLLDNPTEAANLGARAARAMRSSWSYRATGQRLEQRLASIHEGLRDRRQS